MRHFSSYGPIDRDLHFFVPRKELFAKVYMYLVGDNPDKGGHYITVWAPRQTGKSSLMRDIYWNLMEDENFHAANIDLQHLQSVNDSNQCQNEIIYSINEQTGLHLPQIESTKDFQKVFSAKYLKKPLVLIMDEFDSLKENVIHDIVSVFRNIYNSRQKDPASASCKHYLLHGVALIGVRSVVGVENKTGSPFNVQRSLHVNNLTESEVKEMYHWYEKEAGQRIEEEVIDRIFYVTQGNPGLVSWFGELLTEKYNDEPNQPITMNHFSHVYTMAIQGEPNNTVINIISKAKTEPYRHKVLEFFKTDRKTEFRIEKPEINYLYRNGVISYDKSEEGLYVRFPCQFIQEKLFDYFSDNLVKHSSPLLANPFIDLTTVIHEQGINISNLLELYQEYYTRNRDELIEYAQRRIDMRIMEVVYHFQIYSWLDSFLRNKKARIMPEFPTGNGKIDLLIYYEDKCYGLELKSFSDFTDLAASMKQASRYGKSLGLDTITLVVFVEQSLPDELKTRYAQPFQFDDSSSVDVFFIITH